MIKSKKLRTAPRKRWCIFHDCPSKTPAWHDMNNMPVTFPTKAAAEAEVLEILEDHIRQIKTGARRLEDGVGFGDWVEPVVVDSKGDVHDSRGDVYTKRVD
jgi:ketosteroid isomerase-like protein